MDPGNFSVGCRESRNYSKIARMFFSRIGLLWQHQALENHSRSSQCGLTPRSRRGPTSKPQARAVGWRIFHRAGLGFCCRSRLSSNVRHHKMRRALAASPNSRIPLGPGLSPPAFSTQSPDLQHRHRLEVDRRHSRETGRNVACIKLLHWRESHYITRGLEYSGNPCASRAAVVVIDTWLVIQSAAAATA